MIFDGTKRPVQRPKDAQKQKQKQHYSGKKKRYTGSTQQKRVVILTRARAGKVHIARKDNEKRRGKFDKALYRQRNRVVRVSDAEHNGVSTA